MGDVKLISKICFPSTRTEFDNVLQRVEIGNKNKLLLTVMVEY